MRPRADAERINAFVSELGRAARTPARLHLTGGATAVLEGWRGLEDVRAMVAHGLVDPVEARALYERIEPELYRFPAIDPPSFRARVERELG